MTLAECTPLHIHALGLVVECPRIWTSCGVYSLHATLVVCTPLHVLHSRGVLLEVKRARSGSRRAMASLQPQGSSHPLPVDVSLALCMGLHSRLGANSSVFKLDADVCKEISENYRLWFWSRPWAAGEAALCETLWLRGKDTLTLSQEFSRSLHIHCNIAILSKW